MTGPTADTKEAAVPALTAPVRSVPIPAKPQTWYYVETTIMEDGPSGSARSTSFRGHLVLARRPREAEAEAVRDALIAHPGSVVDPFLTRRLTDEKAAKIMEQFEAGTWDGWRF